MPQSIPGLDWTGLDWTGLDWTGPDRTGRDYIENTGPDLTGPDRTGRDGTILTIGLYCTEMCCVRYNPVTQEWLKDECVLKIDKIPFAHGAMRECFR